MIAPDETFDGTFPFAPHFSEAPGFRMHVAPSEGKPRDVGAAIVDTLTEAIEALEKSLS